MGAFAAPAALAVAAIGTVYSGIEERNAARRGAVVDEENGRLAVLSGEQQAMSIYRDERAQAGGAAARMAGSGLMFSGSISDVLADSSYQAELDVLRTRQQAHAENVNYRTQASERRKAGNAALVGSLFSAVSSTVGGVATLRNQEKQQKQAELERKVRLGQSGTGPVTTGGR